MPLGLVGAAWPRFRHIYLLLKNSFTELKKEIIHTCTSVLRGRAKPEAKS